jgi:hypothetical protein
MRTQKRWLYAGLLLLMLAAPMSARAGKTSSEKVYVIPGNAGLENEPVEAAPKGTAPPKGHPGPKPMTGEEARAETNPTQVGEPESRERHEPQAATPGAGGGHPPGGGSDPKQGSSPKPTARSRSAGSTGPTQPEKRPTKVDSSGSGGGGSSPVAPILIAMAVLAALSIGTVIYRGRTPQAS